LVWGRKQARAPTLHAATSQIGPHWPQQVTVHLDAGYDSAVTRTQLDGLGLHGEIARKWGVPAPMQVGKRWVCERTQAWPSSCLAPVALLAHFVALSDLSPSGPVDDPLDALEQPFEHDRPGTRNDRAWPSRRHSR
jgi:hypothetical protein